MKSLQIKTYTINQKKMVRLMINKLNIKVKVIKKYQLENIWKGLDHI